MAVSEYAVRVSEESIARERASVKAIEAREAQQRSEHAEASWRPRPAREVVIGKLAYEVVWDGA